VKRYNVDYKAGKKIIVLKNIDEKQLNEFLNTLEKEENSSLNVKQIKEIDEEER